MAKLDTGNVKEIILIFSFLTNERRNTAIRRNKHEACKILYGENVHSKEETLSACSKIDMKAKKYTKLISYYLLSINLNKKSYYFLKLLFEQRNKKGLNLQQTHNKGLRELKFFCLLIHLKLKSSFFLIYVYLYK